MHSKPIYAHLNEPVNAWHLHMCIDHMDGWSKILILHVAFSQKLQSFNFNLSWSANFVHSKLVRFTDSLLKQSCPTDMDLIVIKR